MTIIEAIGLEKTYLQPGREVEVLRGLDLRVEEGDRVAVMGASGVGKSTLLHLLGTLDRPTGGRVFFRGDDVFTFDEVRLSEFRNRNIGFVFQFHHLLPEFTAVENTMMPALINGVPRDGAASMAEEILIRLGLAERLTHRVGELSGGEQQRVAVARALVLKPSLVLADEPTGNLDPKTGGRLMELLLSLNEELGTTMVLVTHNLDLARLMNRKLRLSDGKVIEEG